VDALFALVSAVAAWTRLVVPYQNQVARQSSSEPDPLTAVANLEARAVTSGDSIIELTLNRPLSPEEGDLVLMVGDVDVTAVSRRTARRIVFQPAAFGLSEGESEVVLFKRKGGRWDEIKRLPIHVLQAAGKARFFTDQSATLGNKGQIAEGRSAGVPEPARRTFQDFVLNAGLHSSQQRAAWSLTTQSNYVGVSRREDALRFGVRGSRAPMLDLSDYSIGLRSPALAFSLGRVTFGTSRHLANSFGARGSTVVLTKGPTSVSLGALSGSLQVGWDDLLGAGATHQPHPRRVDRSRVGANTTGRSPSRRDLCRRIQESGVVIHAIRDRGCRRKRGRNRAN
jgi:hypothetical protein